MTHIPYVSGTGKFSFNITNTSDLNYKMEVLFNVLVYVLHN